MGLVQNEPTEKAWRLKWLITTFRHYKSELSPNLTEWPFPYILHILKVLWSTIETP